MKFHKYICYETYRNQRSERSRIILYMANLPVGTFFIEEPNCWDLYKKYIYSLLDITEADSINLRIRNKNECSQL